MNKLLFRKYLFSDSENSTYTRSDTRFVFSVLMVKLILSAVVATLSLISVTQSINEFAYSYFAFYEMTLVISVLLFIDGFIDLVGMLKTMSKRVPSQFDRVRKTLVLTTSISMIVFFLNIYLFDTLISDQLEMVYFIISLIGFIAITVYMVYKTYVNVIQAVIQVVFGIVLTYMYFSIMLFSILFKFLDF